jgi:hypothetical protein
VAFEPTRDRDFGFANSYHIGLNIQPIGKFATHDRDYTYPKPKKLRKKVKEKSMRGSFYPASLRK